MPSLLTRVCQDVENITTACPQRTSDVSPHLLERLRRLSLAEQLYRCDPARQHQRILSMVFGRLALCALLCLAVTRFYTNSRAPQDTCAHRRTGRSIDSCHMEWPRDGVHFSRASQLHWLSCIAEQRISLQLSHIGDALTSRSRRASLRLSLLKGPSRSESSFRDSEEDVQY